MCLFKHQISRAPDPPSMSNDLFKKNLTSWLYPMCPKHGAILRDVIRKDQAGWIVIEIWKSCKTVWDSPIMKELQAKSEMKIWTNTRPWSQVSRAGFGTQQGKEQRYINIRGCPTLMNTLQPRKPFPLNTGTKRFSNPSPPPLRTPRGKFSTGEGNAPFYSVANRMGYVRYNLVVLLRS